MSFSEWKEVLLEDVADLTVGFVGSMADEYLESGIPFLRSLNIEPFQIKYDGIKYISQTFHDKLQKSKLSPGDVVIVRTGKPGACAVIPNSLVDSNCSDLVIIRPDKQKINSRFLAAYINSAASGHVDSHLVGAVQQHFNIGSAKKINILLPPLPEQKAIADTLSCLDDKIELNYRINQTLEEMAQAIFKSWFVDFEPFQDNEFEDSELGRIPKGWRVGSLGDYVKVKSGYAFKSTWWKSTGVPVIKIKEIENGTINFGDISFVSKDKVELAKEFKVNGGELLIAMTGATIGKFAIVPKMNSYALVNQRVGKFFLGDNPIKKLGFLYCNLKQDEIFNEIVSRGDGSAQPNISPTGIESIKIVLPPVSIINNFNQLIEKCFEMIIKQTHQNAKLSTIRDILLPKLMSGEIRVPVEES